MNKEVIILELASLMRTLEFMQEEQVFIKSKLNSKLDTFKDATTLNWAEDVQQQFINRELAIQLLKNDVQKLDRYYQFLEIKKSPSTEQFKQFKIVQKQVLYLENEFFIWKNKVNDYLELTNSASN